MSWCIADRTHVSQYESYREQVPRPKSAIFTGFHMSTKKCFNQYLTQINDAIDFQFQGQIFEI